MSCMKELPKNRWLFLVLFLSTAALAVISFIKGSVLNFSISRITFYCMSAIFLFWAWLSVQFFKRDTPDIRLLIRKYGPGMLFSLLMAACIFVSVKPGYRILADETNLLSVSKTMLYEKRVDNVTEGKWYFFNFNPVTRETEKRPYMFPFFVHIVHSITGFRAANPFVVNFILMTALFFGIFVFARDQLGAVYGYSAVLLTASQPVISLTAASAGMDFMQVVFLFYAFVILKKFLEQPGKDLFLLLWATLLVVANIRYEGALFAVIILAGLLFFRKIRSSYFDSWLFYLTPFMLLPVFWQRFCLHVDYENPAGVAVFSLQHLLRHSINFLRTLPDTKFVYPYAAVPDILGLVAVLYFVVLLLKKDWPKEEGARQLSWITLACLACYWLLVNAYYLGDPIHPTSYRFFGVVVLALALACIALLARVPFFKGREMLVVLFSAAVFVYYNPLAIENRFTNGIYLGRQFRYEMEFLKKIDDKNILMITDRPNLFTASDYGAVSFDHANANADGLLQELDRHLYKHMYVFQEIEYVTGAPTDGTALNADYALEPVSEIQLTADNFLRISEVKR